MLCSIVALFFIASSVYRDSYGTIEREQAQKDLRRLESVFVDELRQMFTLLEDYASWDDTFEFAQNRSPDYIDSNLSGDTFSNLGVQIVLMLDREGEQLYGSSHGLGSAVGRKALEQLKSQLDPDGDLYERYPREFGLLRIDDRVMMVALAPILRSDDSGPPRGIAVLGRFLDPAAQTQLRQKTQLDLAIEIADPSGETVADAGLHDAFDTDIFAERDALGQSPQVLRVQDDEILMGYILMPDMLGEALLLWQVKIPRDIHQRGEDSLSFLLVAMSVIGLVLLVCILLLLELLVLRRLTRLSSEVATIGDTNDLTARVAAHGQDELGFLSRAINTMLQSIQTNKEKLAAEHERAENLLLNILPASIADQLKDTRSQIANAHEEVSVLFADIVGFTELSAKMEPERLVSMLNDVFSEFDDLAEEIGLEKIKTIGDAYMVAAGLPEFRQDHAEAVAEMALRMVTAVRDYSQKSGHPLNIRIGINSGQVVAGVIGKKKFIYDLWGDTVNIASRMESTGEAGMIQVTASSHALLHDAFELQDRGEIDVKGRGRMQTFELTGRKGDPS